MCCGLSKDELDMLFYLVHGRCLSEKHSIALKAIERDLGTKMEIEEVLNSLANKGYVGCKHKRPVNYWAQAGLAVKVLLSHDYPISLGRTHPIR